MAVFRPQLRFSLRTLFALVTIAGILSAYVGSFCWLRRRGTEEALAWGSRPVGILYISWDEAAATHDLTRHHRLALLYYPLNQLDQLLFGTPGPIRGVTWDLE
jgi:hypothetical protein